jgi:hypothetical protein
LLARASGAEQQESDQTEEEDAGERVGGGREERVAVSTVAEVAVEEERRDEGAADRVQDDAGPDPRAGERASSPSRIRLLPDWG